MNKKRVMALVMSGMMLFSMAGCGSSGDNAAAESKPAAEATEEAAEESTEKAPVLDTVAEDESGTVSCGASPLNGKAIGLLIPES